MRRAHCREVVTTKTTVAIDCIYPLPESWGVCLSCEMIMANADLGQAPYERGLDEYPPEWMAEYQRLSSLLLDLAARYGDQVLIRIFDPRSLQGLAKAVRHWARRYPTFIVNQRHKVAGWDQARLEELIRQAGASEVYNE